MTSPRLSMLMSFLREDLALSVGEMLELRALLDSEIRRRRGPLASAATARTLYFPSEPLDDL